MKVIIQKTGTLLYLLNQKKEKITQYTDFKESYFRYYVYNVGLLDYFLTMFWYRGTRFSKS